MMMASRVSGWYGPGSGMEMKGWDIVADIGGGDGADRPGRDLLQLATGLGKARGEEGGEICVAREGCEPRSSNQVSN